MATSNPIGMGLNASLNRNKFAAYRKNKVNVDS